MAEIAKADLPEIIARYAKGESVQALAEETGVHRATLYRWMLAGVGDDNYADLVTSCLVQRVAEADGKLESSRDPCDIARAREMARFARMDLERRRPALYGPKQQIQQDTSITVQVVRYAVQHEHDQSTVSIPNHTQAIEGQVIADDAASDSQSAANSAGRP